MSVSIPEYAHAQADSVLHGHGKVVEFTGEVHPVAALFPMLAEDELRELAEDIKTNGLLQPVVLDGDGRLLDGRNRLAACRLAEVEPEFSVHDGDPDAYALSVNIARRHLSTGARSVIAAKASRLNGHSTRQVAGDTNLAQQRIVEAGVVLEWAPEHADAVIAGAMPLSKAVAEARDRKRSAESTEAQMSELRSEAPDLAEQVAEAALSLSEALAEAKRRTEEAERLEALPPDLAERVRVGQVDVGEAEAIQRERQERIAANAEKVRIALRTLARMAGHPLADGLSELLSDAERQVLQTAIAAIEGSSYDRLLT